jgi:mannose-6-phosphate isomerase-like protein (cupin superfamily)
VKGFVGDIEDRTTENAAFRRVIYTGKNLQLVLMVLKPGEEIGAETHLGHDQFFRVEKGKGEVWIDGERTKVRRDDAIIVPAGASHNIVNTGSKSLKLYTLYAPPQHRDGLVCATKADAAAAGAPFDGVTTEAPQPAGRRTSVASPSAKPGADRQPVT